MAEDAQSFALRGNDAAIVSNAELTLSEQQVAKLMGIIVRHDYLAQLETRAFGVAAQQGVLVARVA
jgi:hypothetical protein